MRRLRTSARLPYDMHEIRTSLENNFRIAQDCDVLFLVACDFRRLAKSEPDP
jgi:hypothetical protein